MVRIRRLPPSEIGEIHRRMEHVVSSVIHGLEHFVSARGWVPRLDMHETEAGLFVTLELPGVEREDIDVTLQGAYLRIVGVRHAPATKTCVRWHQMEISYGPFERAIVLPWEVDPEGMNATYRDGFLHIEILRAAAAARHVPVTTP
jgi:HSP20 family protein